MDNQIGVIFVLVNRLFKEEVKRKMGYPPLDIPSGRKESMPHFLI